MKRSTDRILTTHAGSLPRPEGLREIVGAKSAGQPYDEVDLARRLQSGVADIVKQQVDSGIDIVNDGELSKTGFSDYVQERMGGLETRPSRAYASRIAGRDVSEFPGYFDETTGFPGGRQRPTGLARMLVSCISPLSYTGQASVQSDIGNFKPALQGVAVEESFLPAIAPGTIEHWLQNEHYPDDESFLFAIADAMKTEYKAIVDAGFILQIDDPGLGETWDMLIPHPTLEEYRKLQTMYVEALNHALNGIPEDRVRYHLCWGSWQGPHLGDLSLRDVVDLVLSVNAQAYSIEAANPRHSWEWKVWEDVKLPDNKVLIPGVIAHTTAVVEHPETVAERIINYARVVGKEMVIAGADCGFAQGALYARQHLSIMWAKFEALAEGARLATQRLK